MSTSLKTELGKRGKLPKPPGKWHPGGRGRPPGGPKVAGRKPGSPNVLTRDIKEMVLTALNNAGGAEYLTKRAFDCPTAFLALVGRVLPMQVTGANGSPLAVDFRWADSDADVAPDMGELDAQHARTQPLTIDGERATDEVS